MKRTFLSVTALTSLAVALSAAPTPSDSAAKNEKSSATTAASTELVRSASGWTFVRGEWVHPDGYKYVNGKVQRTTAHAGHPLPKPPGKLALDNPQKLTQALIPVVSNTTKPADKSSAKSKNVSTRPAPQTGSHL
jgi:hypothetical protein